MFSLLQLPLVHNELLSFVTIEIEVVPAHDVRALTSSVSAVPSLIVIEQVTVTSVSKLYDVVGAVSCHVPCLNRDHRRGLST